MATYIFLSKYILEKLGTTSHIIDFILEFNYRVQLSVALSAGLFSYLSQSSYRDSRKIRISVGSHYLYFFLWFNLRTWNLTCKSAVSSQVHLNSW